MEKTVKPTLKLNYKRTFLIGFAFFGILLFWQVYDSWCPTLLSELFKDALHTTDEKSVQYLVGVVMAMDNLAALILLPIFGHLSDKTNTRIGKRMPYILIGTFVCAVAFPFIPVFYHYNNVAGVVIMMAIVVCFMMMYRNPAVALMPDLTPKPLRSKANGIINIMGYIGGAFATVVGIVFVLSDYLGTKLLPDGSPAPHTWAYNNIWALEAPFLIASVLMVVSAVVLFVKIKENEVKEEIADELRLGEEMSATEDKVDDDKPMTRANKIMLFLILGAEFFWFMADNGVGTFMGNFTVYHLGASTSSNMINTIIGGVGSVIGFAIGGIIASKIGRKWTVVSGLALSLFAYIIWIVGTFTFLKGAAGGGQFPPIIWVIWLIKGFGMSLVHLNSFPMVVELCNAKKIGAFTGYYYASSMAAQTITPIALGSLFLIEDYFDWGYLPVYAAACLVISLAIFMFVKNVKTNKEKITVGLEAIGSDD
ncbi:MAG TPA: SLC45 family MFS transporter [Erysipelotrichaceae bacterium]|nr:SLC45 family MFS transporter [Erysipelotrichaceae bacterium]